MIQFSCKRALTREPYAASSRVNPTHVNNIPASHPSLFICTVNLSWIVGWLTT